MEIFGETHNTNTTPLKLEEGVFTPIGGNSPRSPTTGSPTPDEGGTDGVRPRNVALILSLFHKLKYVSKSDSDTIGVEDCPRVLL